MIYVNVDTVHLNIYRYKNVTEAIYQFVIVINNIN